MFNKTLEIFKHIMPFYAVAKGFKPGIYMTWPKCQAQVDKFSGPIFKKFNTQAEAAEFIEKNSANGCVNNNQSINRNESNNQSDSSPSNSKRKRKNDGSNSIVFKKPKSTGHIVGLKQYGKYEFLEDNEGYVHVYTDGSCENNGKRKAVAGLGVYWNEGHNLNTAAPVSGRATNNCGEIQAATLAIKLAKENNIKKLCINTDSQFVINSVTEWFPNWKKRNWKLSSGMAVKNEEDFKKLDSVMNGITLKWVYVKAHAGILGNERADILAKQGGDIYKAACSIIDSPF